MPRSPLLLFLAVMISPGCARDLPGLSQRSGEEVALRSTRRGEVLPLRPYWDASGSLRWGGPQHALGSRQCDSDATAEAKIWIEIPRIEEIRCYRSGGVLREAWLVSFEADGSVRWRVSLLGDQTSASADRVAGVSEGTVGLESGRWVANDGTVHGHLVTGKPTRLFSPIAWFNDVFVKVVDGTEALTLERIEMTGGARQLLPALPRAGWLSRWRVRDLALSPDGRWLAAALENDWRGPAPVAVAVLDLEKNRWVALESRCPAALCQDPTVLTTSETIGFAYRNVSTARTILVTYSIPK